MSKRYSSAGVVETLEKMKLSFPEGRPGDGTTVVCRKCGVVMNNIRVYGDEEICGLMRKIEYHCFKEHPESREVDEFGRGWFNESWVQSNTIGFCDTRDLIDIYEIHHK